MDLVVRAFPVLEGQEEALREFASNLRDSRSAGAAGFYARFGVTRESWHTQQTPQGTWVICVTEIGDQTTEQAAKAYASSDLGFDQWFKTQVKKLTGIDPDEHPLGPPTECIFDTSRI